jgi:PIN domain
MVAKRRTPGRRSPRKTATRARRPTTTGAAIRYMESSALVAALLEHDMAAKKRPPVGTQLVTSALTLAEAARAIILTRATGRLTAAEEQAAVRALRTFERRCFLLDVDRAVLARVSRPFPIEPIRTLDAVHLATTELLDETPQVVTIVTRDVGVRDNARALGYIVE